jgi:hypothetical protein
VSSFDLGSLEPVATPTVTPGPSPVATPTVTPEPARAAPETSFTSGPAEGSAISDNTPTFGFAASMPRASFSCYVPTSPSYSYWSPSCPSPFTISEALPDGHYEFPVTARNEFWEAAWGTEGIDLTPAIRKFTVDTVRPVATLKGPLTQTAGSSIGVTVSCGAEACTAVASGSVSVPGAARVFRLRPATKRVAAGRKANLRVRVPKKALAAIRGALQHQSKVTAKLAVRVKDKAGNARTRRRSVKLRR